MSSQEPLIPPDAVVVSTPSAQADEIHAAPTPAASPRTSTSFARLLWACVGCSGIVFGDLGTSPIYAFREAFATGPSGALAQTEENILGVLSLIFLSLTVVVTWKYLSLLCYIEGPGGAGGSLALMRTLKGSMPNAHALEMLGMVALALFLADSLIAPGVSVLSAVEVRCCCAMLIRTFQKKCLI